MAHTLKVIAGGFVLLALCLFIGRLSGSTPAIGLIKGAKVFIPLWLLAAGINMWVGVSKAGYSVREETPIFLLVFAIPAAIALLLLWTLSRG
jgi:hypothetical protein